MGASESFKSASVAILGATVCPRGSCASLAVSWKLATERSGRPTHLASMHFSFSPEFKPNCLIYGSCIGLSKPVFWKPESDMPRTERKLYMSTKGDMDNHSNQLNPNNDEYWGSRGYDGRPDDWEEEYESSSSSSIY